MKITVLTLFPKIFDNFLKESIIKRILQNKIAQIEIIDFREFSKVKGKRVDDYQYGGGPGMVIQLQPIVDAIKKYRQSNSRVILLTPQGQTFTQSEAKRLSKCKHIILIAGHNEGFDERILHYVDETISIGDYVLTGGEIPAMVLIESITRLLDEAINHDSLNDESFNNGLLDYPVYTKPLEFEKHKVPDVLLSGNHQKIQDYRYKQRLLKTKINRPDLYKKHKKGE